MLTFSSPCTQKAFRTPHCLEDKSHPWTRIESLYNLCLECYILPLLLGRANSNQTDLFGVPPVPSTPSASAYFPKSFTSPWFCKSYPSFEVIWFPPFSLLWALNLAFTWKLELSAEPLHSLVPFVTNSILVLLSESIPLTAPALMFLDHTFNLIHYHTHICEGKPFNAFHQSVYVKQEYQY